MIATASLVGFALVAAAGPPPPLSEPGAMSTPRPALGVLPTLNAEGYVLSLMSVEGAAVAAAVDAAASRSVTCELPAAFSAVLEERAQAGRRCAPTEAACLVAVGKEVGVPYLLTLQLDAVEEAIFFEAGLFDVVTGRFLRKERERLPDDVVAIPSSVQRQVAVTLNSWKPDVLPLPREVAAPVVIARETTGLVDGLGLVRGALLVGGSMITAGGFGAMALSSAFAGGALGTWLYGGAFVPAKYRAALYPPGAVALWTAPVALVVGTVGVGLLVSSLVFFDPPGDGADPGPRAASGVEGE